MARKTRGRMSRIEQLPAAIKDRVDSLLREGVSQAEIIRRLEAPLREAGEPPLSHAGLNRYATKMAEVGAEIREYRAIAEAWRSKFGEQPVSDLGQLTGEVLSTLAFKAALRASEASNDDDDSAIDVEAIGALALALQRVERAAETSTRREKELREAYARETTAAQEKVIKSRGIDGTTAAELRRAVSEV